MKLIEASVEILKQENGLIGMMKHIERCGRVAYKSEDKITDDSYKQFVDMIASKKHNAVLEHGTVYLSYRIDYNSNPSANGYSQEIEWEIMNFINKYTNNEYSKVITYKIQYANFIAITTNYRTIIENDWLDDLKYQCDPTEYHEKRISVNFIIDRGISHEFVRHRKMSFVQESTRFCNYSKGKFGGEITFIEPSWLKDIPHEYLNDNLSPESLHPIERCDSAAGFLWGLELAEETYFELLRKGLKPQQARQILPNALKTELIMTGFESDWEHFFMLRCAPDAHPDAQFIANKLKNLFKNE